MVKILIKRGLDIPLKEEAVERETEKIPVQTIAYDFSPFSHKKRIRAKVSVGDQVKIGDTLAIDPHFEKRVFLSPAAGKVLEITRGEKRRLLSIIIEKNEEEEKVPLTGLNPDASKEEIIDALFEKGLSPYIFKRPFNELIEPGVLPREIFINATSTAPLDPDPENQLIKKVEIFQQGVDFLTKIAPCHLVSQGGPFDRVSNVTHHSIKGPHPAGMTSVHIDRISPIKGVDDCVWTIGIDGVSAIGSVLGQGEWPLTKTVAVTGPGFKEEGRKLYETRIGSEIEPIVKKWEAPHIDRIISGNVLTGKTDQRHVGFFDNQICALSQQNTRRIIPFMRLFSPNFSFFRIYAEKKKVVFSTKQCGEKRAIVDGSLYQKVMPMNIPVEALIKALMAKDFDMALDYGLLKVVPEDFALCEFICPSKMPLTKIVEEGTAQYLELYR